MSAVKRRLDSASVLPRWGFIFQSVTYSEKLKDPRWQKKRLLVLARDKFTCRGCDDAKSTLHVHHCYYFKGDPWDTPDEYLVTSCEKCHKLRQVLEEEGRRALALIFTRCEIDPAGCRLSSLVNSLKQAAVDMPIGYYCPEVFDQGEISEIVQRYHELKVSCPTAT